MGHAWPAFEVLDTVRLARYLMATPQEVPDRKLATLASFFGTPVRPSHRALDDARATAAVLGRLLARLADREEIGTLDQLNAWLAARDAEAAARRAPAAGAVRRCPEGRRGRGTGRCGLAGQVPARGAGYHEGIPAEITHGRPGIW